MSETNESEYHENVFPYILLLPIDSEKRHTILKNVFSSEIGLKIFRKLGTGDILQKNIIETLKGHSNKTIIQKLKLFKELGLLTSSGKKNQ